LKKRTQFAGLSGFGNGLRRDERPETRNSKSEIRNLWSEEKMKNEANIKIGNFV